MDTRSLERGLGHGLFAIYVALLVWNVSELSRHVEVYRALGSASIWMGVRVLALVAAGVAGIWLWTRRFSRISSAAFARGLVYVLALAVLAGSLQWEASGARWEVRMTFMTVLPAALAGWAIGFGSLRLRSASRASNSVRRVESVTSSLCLTLVVMELGLILWATWAPSPLVAGSRPESALAAMRRPPHSDHLGESLNSQGFADQEFFQSGPDDLVVAVISDSFGLAVVPPRFNFVQVAEAELQAALTGRFDRIAVHNFGVPGAGLPVHALLLENEVGPTHPRVVVLCVFIGNDILDGSGWGGPIRERYAFQNWILWNTARRASRLAGYESHSLERAVVTKPGGAVALDVEEWPNQDSPTFSEKRFMEIERSRIGVTRPDRSRTESKMRAFLEGVDWFHRQRGEELLIVLIPDEFQVNDRLWLDLLAEESEPDRFRRDWPQQTILEHCHSRGIACLDLLPVLRRTEARGRTYKPRDTHWNLRGNRAAGESLGQRLVEMLQN